MKRLFLPCLLLLAMLAGTAASAAAQLPGPLVETDWLAANKDAVVILDVRADVKSFTAKPFFRVDKKTGKKQLLRVGGHIDGARLINYKKVRSTRMIDGKKVTRMVPEKDAFAALLQAAGVNDDSVVVIATKGVSSSDMTIATRMYWQMKYFGHDNLAILNGGLAQWLEEGRAVTSDAPVPAKGNWTPKAERAELLAQSDEVAKAAQGAGVQLVDNRPLDQYLGLIKRSYVYDKGHIPTAKVLPTSVITRAEGAVKFLSPDDLRTVLGAMRIQPDQPSIAYCNSGHLASGGWFVMHELLGNKNVKLYDGSMHQWTLEKRPTTSMTIE